MDRGDDRLEVRREPPAAGLAPSSLGSASALVGVFAIAFLFADAPTKAAEACWMSGPAQFDEGIQYCVSAVAPSAGGGSDGPRSLASGDPRAAWCAPAPKAGETVWAELRIDRGAQFRRLLVQNGYGESADSYQNNSRPKTVSISVDGGSATRVILPDSHDLSPVALPGVGAFRVVRIELVDVYPGLRSTDICLGYVSPDFEYEETLHQAGEGPPTPPSKGLGSLGFPAGLDLNLDRK
jgi:hypothetical protein